MKRHGLAVDGPDKERLIAETRRVWQSRSGCDLADDDARRIVSNVSGFFATLAEWARAEEMAPANDVAPPADSSAKVNDHDR